MPNVDGGSLWELVEQRAAATPGRARGGRRGRAHPHVGRGQDRGRAGRGRARPPRHRCRRRRVVAAADVAREQAPRARPGPPRRHPEPDAPDLPRARGRLHHPPGQEQAARGAVHVVGLRLRGDGQGHRGRASPTRAVVRSRCSWPTRRCRRAIRPRSRRRPTPATTRSAGTSTRRAPPPIRRARMHTDHTIKASAVGMCERLEITDADVNAVVFPFTHIGGIGWLFSALVYGFPTVYIERFDPAKTIEMIQQHNVTLAGAGTPFHMAYLAAQRQLPDGRAAVPERARLPGRRRAEAAAAALRHQGRDGRRRHRVRLRAHRGADHHDGQRARLRRAARQHRGQGHRHHAAAHRHARGQGGRHRRGGRDPRQGPAAHEGLPRQLASTPRRSTRTAGSRPATSGASTPTAWSRSPAG